MIFLDTSGLLGYLHQSKPDHDAIVRHVADADFLLTHNYVLAELVALTIARRLPTKPVLGFLLDLNDLPIEVVYVDDGLHRSAADLLTRRPDKAWSLCDAVSFVLMAERRITTALTTDRHFEQAGFSRLLRG